MRGVVAFIVLLAAPAQAGDLRFATWNIANFWHVPGEYLQPARASATPCPRCR